MKQQSINTESGFSHTNYSNIKIVLGWNSHQVGKTVNITTTFIQDCVYSFSLPIRFFFLLEQFQRQFFYCIWRKNKDSRNTFLLEISSRVIKYWITLMVGKKSQAEILLWSQYKCPFYGLFNVLNFNLHEEEKKMIFNNFYVSLLLFLSLERF